MNAEGPQNRGKAEVQPLLFPILTSATASIITGTALVATRYVVPQTDGLTIATLRYVVAAACILPLVPAFYRFNIAVRDLLPIAALGVLYFCIFPWCISAAMEYTTASDGSVILTSTPAVTLLLGSLTRSETWSGGKAFGVAFSILGAAVAVSSGGFEFSDSAWFGNGLMVLATLCGAVYAVFSKPYLAKYSPLTVTAFAMASGAIVLLLVWSTQNHASGIPQLDASGWWAILYIGAAGGALSFFLYAWALGRTTPTVTMILLPLHPIAAILGGALFLGEPLGVSLFIGLALVIIGIVFVVNVESQKSLDVVVRGIGEP